MRCSKLILKSIAQKVMAKYGFECRFHDLKYLEVRFFLHISGIHYKLEGTITKMVNLCK